MQAVDLLISARWTIPVEPDGAVLEGYSVAVHEGRIVELGPAAALAGRYLPAARVVRDRHVLLPGFVDAHTSAARSLLRDALPRGPASQWIGSTLRPLENRWASAEFVRAGTLHAIAGMIRGGITCFADTYLFPEEVARLAGELRLRIAVGLPIVEGASPWAENAADCLDRASALWDAHKSDPWARLHFAPDPAGAVTRETLGRLRRMVDQLDAPVAMRVHDHAGQLRAFETEHGQRPLPWLASLGLLRPGFTALHANHLAPAEIDLLARSGVGVVHCPKTALRLGNGVAPVAALRERGACVGLGTGSAAAGLGLPDVLAEAQLAALLAGGSAPSEPGALSAVAALRMATLDGAQVLGLGAEIGSIVPGKSADLICIDLAATSVVAASRVPDALVYDGSSRDVTDAWIAGRAHLAEGQLCLVDGDRVADAARQWSARMGLGESR
jgi:5-methylthioadenosine/S-adenosylhomocysteine deaminase